MSRIELSNVIFGLQLTSVGAIFGLALSELDLQGMLLVVPFSSYVMCSRYVLFHLGVVKIGDYIKDELSPRTGGHIRWEAWTRSHRATPDRYFIHPVTAAFTLPATVSLVWGGGALLTSDSLGAWIYAIAAVAWIGGAVSIMAMYRMTVRTFRGVGLQAWLPASRSVD
jgi:hypothetical protein